MYSGIPETIITASKCGTLKHTARQVFFKCFIADRVTYSQSRTFAQPLAIPVDPVLTAFEWISAYYTVNSVCLESRQNNKPRRLAFACQ